MCQVPAPTCWLVGARDRRFGALAEDAVERMQRAGRDAALRRVPGAGHNPLLEQPARLAAAIAADTVCSPDQTRGTR